MKISSQLSNDFSFDQKKNDSLSEYIQTFIHSISNNSIVYSNSKSFFVDHYKAIKSFLDSLQFSVFSIKYTKPQIDTLFLLLQHKYPFLELNNNQPTIDQPQKIEIYYKCMNPTCRDTCKKRIQSLLYNNGKQTSKKHDYSCILDDNVDYIHPALCCLTCNRILSHRQEDTIFFKNTNHFSKVYRSISMDDQSEYSKYRRYMKVENIVSTNSGEQIPISVNHSEKGYVWTKIIDLCDDLSYQSLIQRQIVSNMISKTKVRRRKEKIKDENIDDYLQMNGITLENLIYHALDQLEKQLDTNRKLLLCYLTGCKLSHEKGSLYYISPERLDQNKPYLYRDSRGEIQRNFVFICQLLNTTKQNTPFKFFTLCISHIINEKYGVTYELCEKLVNEDDFHENERIERVRDHINWVNQQYKDCVDYINMSLAQKYKITKPVLHESLQLILGGIKTSCKRYPSKKGDIQIIKDLLNIWKSNFGLCYYSGYKMNLQGGEDLKISPERLDDSGSYSKNNVRFICAELNVGKPKGHLDSNVTGSNSKETLQYLIQHTIKHHKFDQLLEDRYYDENEVKQVVEKYISQNL
jgi:hypothetical protein